MGIKDINDTIKDITKDVISVLNTSGNNVTEYVYHTIPLSNFRGQKIAFDASMCLNAKIITAHNDLLASCTDMSKLYDRRLLQQRFIKDIIAFFGTFMKEGITPVIVFDGQVHPYKLAEIEKRKSVKQEKEKHIDEVKERYSLMHPLDRTQEIEEEMRKTLKNYIKITKEDRLLMKTTLQELGFTCIDAPYDGEKTCAALCREGLVAAVFGNDTDNYPLGTPYLITKIGWNGINNTCDIVVLNELLFVLSCYLGYQCTQEILIDICIIHGCDFNERMVLPKKKHDPINPYKSCGAKTGLDLIKQYRQFENFPQVLYCFLEPLNIGICRYMFSYEPSGITDVNMDWKLFQLNFRRILSTYMCERYIEIYFTSVDVNCMHIKEKIDTTLIESKTEYKL